MYLSLVIIYVPKVFIFKMQNYGKIRFKVNKNLHILCNPYFLYFAPNFHKRRISVLPDRCNVYYMKEYLLFTYFFYVMGRISRWWTDLGQFVNMLMTLRCQTRWMEQFCWHILCKFKTFDWFDAFFPLYKKKHWGGKAVKSFRPYPI